MLLPTCTAGTISGSTERGTQRWKVVLEAAFWLGTGAWLVPPLFARGLRAEAAFLCMFQGHVDDFPPKYLGI